MPSTGAAKGTGAGSADLQAREQRYRKLNAELEEKTASLLKEADDVLQGVRQFGRSEIDTPESGEDVDANRNHCSSTPWEEKCVDVPCAVSVHSDLESNAEDERPLAEVLPEPATKLSFKAQNRYLKAKAQVLQEEIQRMNTELSNFHEDNSRLRKRIRELEEERNRLNRVTSSHSAQVERVKKSLEETRIHCDALETERNALKKDGETVKRAANQQAAELKSAQTRLHKTAEEVERLRTDLERLRSSARESSDSMRRQIDQLTADNRRLERQKTDLINAFKKQLRLIDVLRRQKMLIEASKCLQLTEEEFLKALDWQPP
ncbi:unnamed protein product [Calicophoron daubneyi]|uniref:Testis-expressed sequence 9 protein n=1 Tax=Calicophoron daubneyi TaxID=300641 RepID=A0AAV2TPV1_CALDB